MTGDFATFERRVLGQEPVPAAHYDVPYFTEDWRAEGNRYDVDTRRRVEGRHPALIKEIFSPEHVLDVGCGPGFLMLFLHELGVDVRGIDFAPAALELAPAAVRDRIVLGEVVDAHVPERSHDLVICREVLEHLSALQIRRVVAQLCRASSRFVYVTARFHPAPRTLLDLADDRETDPTHITLVAKDLVRVLLVLEGFRGRPDLEARLDWAGKGRVLVHERISSPQLG
jgi:SAM-dependent methyltransferase